jgi:nucleotidyltransferase/DNA polymerase involved in DNA repair
MAPLSLHDFPRAILHIDGDAFFASCEQSRRPKLQGRPVVTGKERGIAASMSYEAKARGVTRGMRLAEIRKRCPEAVILPSDYETYSLLSKRFFAIVRRYTPEVEAYSIDECFCDLTGLRRPLRMSYLQIAERGPAHMTQDIYGPPVAQGQKLAVETWSANNLCIDRLILQTLSLRAIKKGVGNWQDYA